MPDTSDLSALGLTQQELDLYLEYSEAIEAARSGDPAKYVVFQWPGVTLDLFQWDILYSLVNPEIRDIYTKGNTGCGKGAASGIGIVLHYDIYPDSKTRITSKSVEHARDIMFAEAAKWFRAARFRPKGDLLKESIWDNDQHLVTLVNPDRIEGFSGFHGVHTFFVFDEGTAISDDKYTMAYTQAKKLLVNGNSRTLCGAYRSAFRQEGIDPDVTQTVLGLHGPRRLITIDGADCMNVREKRLDSPTAPIGGIEIGGRYYERGQSIPPEDYAKVQPIIPGQTCYNKYIAMLNDPDPFVVQVLAKAKFPDEDPEKQLILGSWLDRHCSYWSACMFKGSVDPLTLGRADLEKIPCPVCGAQNVRFCPCTIDELIPVEAFGLDVALSLTGDETILSSGGRLGVRRLFPGRYRRTSDLGKWVIDTIEENFGISLETGCFPIAVDCDGIGKGTGDWLEERGCQRIEIKGNATPLVDPQRYANLRTECYGLMSKRLSPLDKMADRPFALPFDAKLKEELCAPEKIPIGNDGLKFRITPKDSRGGDDIISIKKRLGRSPDRADAVCYLYQGILTVDDAAAVAMQIDPTIWQPRPDNSWAALGHGWTMPPNSGPKGFR
jgi:hypothetical protein